MSLLVTICVVYFSYLLTKITGSAIVNAVTELMLDDAKELLPTLLNVAARVDAVLLSVPVLIPSIDRMSELACLIVHEALAVCVKPILFRRESLQRVFSSLQNAMHIIRNKQQVTRVVSDNWSQLKAAIARYESDLKQLQNNHEQQTKQTLSSSEVSVIIITKTCI